MCISRRRATDVEAWIKSAMLSYHFGVLTIMGVWCPVYWTSNWRFAYNLYSVVVISLMYSLALSQLARVILVKQNFDEFNDTFFILLSTNFACFKAACNLLNQKKIVHLLRVFEEKHCAPRDDFERDLQRRYDDTCRKMAVNLLVMVEIASLFTFSAPLASNGIETRELPYKVLLPYGLSNPLFYWLTYAHHAFGAVAFTAISIINDAIITGFMLQLTGQLEILQHRFDVLPSQAAVLKTSNRERRLFKDLVQHHTHIIDAAKLIASTFYQIIAGQYFISALEICLSVYQLSRRASNNAQLLTYALYLVCMLGQLFVYCYFGNELLLQSRRLRDSLFSIDWTPLSLELKKNLAFVIQCSSKPIEVSRGAFVRLTLESFVNIVKMSYSAFSVLKSSA